MTNDSNTLEAALLRAMTLLSTLSAAAEVAFGMRERRAGRDPSGQENDEVARPYLLEAGETAQGILLQLRASLIVGSREERDAVSFQVRRFSELQQVRRLAPIFQRIHQRLLSLYPAVTEQLVEEAREILLQTEKLIEAAGNDRYHEEAGAFIERAMRFCTRLLREIDPTLPKPST